MSHRQRRFSRWSRKQFAIQESDRCRRERTRRLRFESLEDRRLLATVQIQSLTADNASVFSDHTSATGDDRGGIALSNTHVFYTGDSQTGRFPINNLSAGVGVGFQFDALVSDLDSRQIYSLGSDSKTPIPEGGGLVSHLLLHDGGTGLLTGATIALSSSVSLNFGAGIFAGDERAVLWNDDSGDVFEVDVGGSVTKLGNVTLSHAGCESWAFWGVAEEFNGDDYLTYVQNSQTIVRTRISDGATSTVASFPGDLSDMCSFTVSIQNQRWYFHNEGGGLFGGSNETIGFADADIDQAPFRLSQVAPDPRTTAVDFVDVRFDFAVNSATFDFNDITLKRNNGVNLITPAVSVVDQGSNVYRIGNLASLTGQEGRYLLKVSGAGILDVGGTPVPGNDSERWLFDAHFPPLEAVEPLGSLIYEGVVSRSLPTPADVQSLQIDVDAGQTITVAVVPNGSLQPKLSVQNPSNASIGSTTATSPGQSLLLQSLPAPTAGTYTVTIESTAGTTGNFTVQVFLNASLEAEQYGAPSNNTLGTAQNIDASFMPLGVTGAERGAVVGHVGLTLFSVDGFQNTLRRIAAGTGAELSSVVITIGGNPITGAHALARDPTTGDLYAVVERSGTIGDLVIINPETGVATSIADLAATGRRFNELAFDSSGKLYGLTGVSSSDPETLFQIDKTNGAQTLLLALSAGGGGSGDGLAFNPDDGLLYRFQGGIFQSINPVTLAVTNISTSGANPFRAFALAYAGSGKFLMSDFSELYSITTTGAINFVFSVSGANRIQGLVALESATDTFSFSLDAGELASLVLDDESTTTLELVNSGGIVLATGITGARNVSTHISNFVAAAPGTYYARVSSIGLADYRLLVTRNAAFDIESNSRLALAQDIDPADTVLGQVSSSDEYAAASTAFAFEDISATGTSSGISSQCQETGNIAVGFNFNYFNQPVNTIHALWNGTIRVGTAFGDVACTSSGAQPIPTPGGFGGDSLIAGWWSTLSPNLGGQVIHQTLGTPGDRRFIIQYHQVPDSASTPITFQIKIFERDNSIEVHYVNAPQTSGDSRNSAGIENQDGTAGTEHFFGVGGLLANSAVRFAGNDFYSFSVNSGDALEISTLTPADGSREFVNQLDPLVELFGPNGASIATNDNGAADLRNALLMHTATLTGRYTVRIVAANNTKGEYVLHVAGNTGTPAPMEVVATNPPDGQLLQGLSTIDVDFSTSLDLLSVDASDLKVNGMPATRVEIIDGNTLRFDIAALQGADGPHTVQINAGALASLHGTTNLAFSMTLNVDSTSPVVTASTVSEASVIGAGNLTLILTVNETLNSGVLGPEDVFLQDSRGFVTSPTNLSYNNATREITISFTALVDEFYRFTLFSGANAAVDLAGNLLNGAPSFPLPSGQGDPAADSFAINFIVDSTTLPFPVPLSAEKPLGSLIYTGTAPRSFLHAGDVDVYTINLDAGQTVTATLNPEDPSLQTSLEMFDPNGVSVGTAAAAAAGAQVVMQTAPVAIAGTYAIRAARLAGTGGFTLEIVLNAAAEDEEHSGLSNNSIGTAQNINASFTSLRAGTAQRGAVLGNVGRGLYSVDRFQDRLREVDPTNGAELSSIVITVGGNPISGSHALARDPTTGDLYAVVERGGASGDLVIINPVTGVATSIADLAVTGRQFDELAFHSNGTLYGITGDSGTDIETLFQINKTDGTQSLLLALSSGGNGSHESLAFNSDDGLLYRFQGAVFQSINPVTLTVTSITTSGPGPFQAQAMTYIGGAQFLFSYFSGLHSLTTAGVINFLVNVSGASIVQGLVPAGQDADTFSFSLAAGQTVTLALAGVSSTLGFGRLELLDSGGGVLAVGVSAANLDQVISNFAVNTAGTYYARVTKAFPSNYSLVVTRDAAFDTESNSELASAQNINGIDAVLGYVSSIEYVAVSSTFNFEDISTTGTATDITLQCQETGDIPIGFSVNYFDQTENTIHALWNGTIRVGTVSGDVACTTSGAQPFPTPGGLGGDSLIAGWWATLVPSSGQIRYQTLGTTGDRRFIIQYHQVPDFASIPITFQIKIFERDSAIEVHYVNAPQTTGDAQNSAGVENRDGTIGAQHFFGGGGLPANSAVRFRRLDDFYSLSAIAGEVLNFGTLTPSGGTGEFANNFDPLLELFDPSGASVAQDNNSGLDGRNAVIRHTATMNGTYKVRVRGANASSGEYVLDTDAPGLTSFTRLTPATSPTNADTLIFRATFDDDVTGVGTADFAVNGSTTATVTSVAQLTARTYDVMVSSGDLVGFNGGVSLNLSGSQNITDLAGNALPATEPATDENYTVDNDPPGVTSFARLTPATSPTNADTLVFRATFDEEVTGVSTADFTVNGTTTATVTGMNTVSGSVYDVTISGGDLASINGLVGLNLSGSQNVTDLAGNALPAGEPATDQTYTVDNDPPGLTSFARQTPATSPTNVDTLVFRATFDEPMTAVDTADFSVNGTTTATVTGVIAVSGSVYDVTIAGGDLASFTGVVGLNLSGSQNITDLAGNALPAGEPVTDETYTLDNTPPSTTSFVRQAPGTSPTSVDVVVFRATFSETLTAIDATDFAVNGTTTAIVSGVTPVSGSVYDVTISGGDLASFNGLVGLNLSGSQNITDLASNVLPAGEPVTDETYTLDNTPPSTTSFVRQTPGTSPTGADVLVFRATLSETVTAVDVADFAVNGATTATVTGVTSVSGSVYNVTISGGDLATFNGVVGLNLSGSQNITDSVGNMLSAGEPATDETYTLDNTSPSTTSFVRQTPATSPTNADTLVFRATFSETVTALDAADFAVNGATTATVTGVTSVSGSVYDVTISGGDLASLNGVIGLNLSGSQNITDAIGSPLPAGEPSTDETYTLDNTPPSTTSFVRQTPATSPTNADTLVFRTTFSETIVAVDATDFAVNGTTTATITGVTAVSGSVYDVTVSGGDLVSFNGAVGLNLSASHNVTDRASNALPVAEPATDATYLVDNIGPIPLLSSNQTSPSKASTIGLIVNFGEPVIGFVVGDLGLTNVTAGNFQDLGGGQFSVDITPTVDGVVQVNVANAVAQDVVGNSNTAATTFSIVSDRIAPPAPVFTAISGDTGANNTDTITNDTTLILLGTAEANTTATVTRVGTGVIGAATVNSSGVWSFDYTGTVLAVGSHQFRATAMDLAGNISAASADLNVVVDVTGPTPLLSSTETSPTKASPIPLTINFGEAVIGFGLADISVTNGSASNLQDVGGGRFTLNVAPTADGNVQVNVAASSAQDLAGNNNKPATTFSIASARTLSVTISAASILEKNGATVATVTRPDTSGDVTVNLLSNDTSEANVVASVMIADGQSTSPAFNISAVDDTIVDGTQTVTIRASAAGYLDGSDTLDVTDDDVAGFSSTETGGTSVDESGSTDTFTVVLDRQPLTNVVIAVTSDDTGEATVDKTSLTFTPANWNTAQTVTVSGVDDLIDDGNQTTAVTLSIVDANSDNAFDALADQTVAVTTTDNDSPQDFGDAPDDLVTQRYPSLFVHNGARHRVGSLFLGGGVDADLDGQPTAGADGDTQDDGVLVIASPVALATTTTRSSFLVTASQAGKLDAWIDFNRDNDWNDDGEQILTTVGVAAGKNILTYTVPAGATQGATVARFRLSSAGGLSPTGLAADGEVEDYLVTILDGDSASRADVEIELPTANVTVVVQGNEIVVRSGTTELFRAPGNKLTRLNLLGTPQNDVIDLANLSSVFTGIVFIDGQLGDDTLRLIGGGQTLNLSQLPAGSLQNIEIIIIRGSGVNSLTLTPQQVLALSNTTDVLSIQADSDDPVNIGTGWKLSSTAVENGAFVRVLTNSGATLRIIGPLDWTNPSNKLDVNANGSIEPIDVLIIINELNDPRFSNSNRLVSAAGLAVFPGFFYDTSADGFFVVPQDALIIINFLNSLIGSPEGERSDKSFQALLGDAVDLVIAAAPDRDPGAVENSLPIVSVRSALDPAKFAISQTVQRSAADSCHPAQSLRDRTIKLRVGNDRNTDLLKQSSDSLESILDAITEDVATQWDASRNL